MQIHYICKSKASLTLHRRDDVLRADPGCNGRLSTAESFKPEADLPGRCRRIGRVLDLVKALSFPVGQRIHNAGSQFVLGPFLVFLVAMHFDRARHEDVSREHDILELTQLQLCRNLQTKAKEIVVFVDGLTDKTIQVSSCRKGYQFEIQVTQAE